MLEAGKLAKTCLALHRVHTSSEQIHSETQAQHLAFNWIQETNPICCVNKVKTAARGDSEHVVPCCANDLSKSQIQTPLWKLRNAQHHR